MPLSFSVIKDGVRAFIERPQHILGALIMIAATQGAVIAAPHGIQLAQNKGGEVEPGSAASDSLNRRQRLQQLIKGGPGNGRHFDRSPEGGGDLSGEFNAAGAGARREMMRQRFRQGQMAGRRQATLGDRQLFGRHPLDLSPLNLTDAQKEKIRGIRGKTSEKAREIRRVMQAKQKEMRDLMFDPDAGDDLIRSKRFELRKLRDQIEEMTINDFLSIRAVLTPEQKKRLPEIKPTAQRQAAGGRRPGPGVGFGGAPGRMPLPPPPPPPFEPGDE